MAPVPNRTPLSISPWWALLLLPAALSVGWLAGRVPTAAAPQPVSAAAALAELSDWTSFTNATAESKRSGKPVLLDFNADWCGPCQALKHEVFEAPEYAGDVQRAVIPVSVVDRKHEDGSNPPETQALQHLYGVHAFPTLVVYSPVTHRIRRMEGYGDPDEMLRWIRQSAKAVR